MLGNHSHWKKTFLVNFCIDVFATQKQALKKTLTLGRSTHTYNITNRGTDTGYLFHTVNTRKSVSLRLEALLSYFFFCINITSCTMEVWYTHRYNHNVSKQNHLIIIVVLIIMMTMPKTW